MINEEETPLHALYRRIADDRDAVSTALKGAIDRAMRDLAEARARLDAFGPVNSLGVLQRTGPEIDRLCGEYMRLDALAKEADRLLTLEEEGGGEGDGQRPRRVPVAPLSRSALVW
jgi:hypothetical protein